MAVAGTTGPVYEPFLVAFPRPDEFLPLLLSGQYSWAEAYYRAKPYNSWMMTLIGDPLYNPFRVRPGIRVDELPEAYQKLIHAEEWLWSERNWDIGDAAP